MTTSSKREKQTEWICRILMTVDVYAIVGGYLSYFQTKEQLVSPLIPQNTFDQVLADSHVMEKSLISAILFLVGLWFYSFRKQLIAIIFFSLAILLSLAFNIAF